MSKMIESLECRRYLIGGSDGPGGDPEPISKDTPRNAPGPDLAVSLGTYSTAGAKRKTGALSSSHQGEAFKVTLKSKLILSLDLRGMSNDLDIFLFDSTGKVIASSKKAGSANEHIAKTLRRGTYYVGVYYLGSASPFTLRAGTRLLPA